MYLYPGKDDVWNVGATPGESKGWLKNPSPSKTLPTSGWQYYDSKAWQDDPSLTITLGPLPPLCSQYNVGVTGAANEKRPSYQGVFTRTDRWWLGRPVYDNTQGRLLYHGAAADGWVIGSKLGYNVLRGYEGAHVSPVSQSNWKYYVNQHYEPANVTVTSKCEI